MPVGDLSNVSRPQFDLGDDPDGDVSGYDGGYVDAEQPDTDAPEPSPAPVSAGPGEPVVVPGPEDPSGDTR